MTHRIEIHEINEEKPSEGTIIYSQRLAEVNLPHIIKAINTPARGRKAGKVNKEAAPK